MSRAAIRRAGHPLAKRGPRARQAMPGLRDERADEGRPVAEGGALARAVVRPTAGAEQVIAGAAGEERPAPGRVVAGLGNVFAGDPDRVAVDGRRAVVAPAGARRGAADLLRVAGEAVGRRGPRAAVDDIPGADAAERVDRRVGRARVE